MKKIISVIAAVALGVASVWFLTWHSVLVLPVIVFVLVPIVVRRSVNPEKIQEIKSLPSEDKDPAKIWLNGSWELRYPAGDPVEIKLPSDLAAVRGMSAMKGPFTYIRHVEDIPAGKGKKLFLCGRGIGGRARFFINGFQCGESPGYIPFEIDISEATGGVVPFELKIEVYPGKRPGAPGNLMGLAPPYGIGIFRELFIETRNAVFIRRAWFDTQGGLQYVTVELGGGTDHPSAVAVTIRDKEGNVLLQKDEVAPLFDRCHYLSFGVGIDTLEPWTPEAPVLYEIDVMLLSGEVRQQRRFASGLKTAELRGGEIIINGDKADLRGAVRCEHYPPYGAAVPNWAARKDARAVKDAGMDLVYCQDYPPHPDFMDSCDRAGVHVVMEFPIRHISEPRSDNSHDLDSCLREAVSHPSFLFFVMPGSYEHLSDKVVHGHRLVFERNLGDISANGGVMKLNVDLYSFGHFARQLHRYGDSDNGGLLVLNYIDTEAGRESRNKRELRKTDADLETLKLADKNGTGSLAIGQFFTWGIMSGINSINRKKKASADAVKMYLKNRSAGEITWAELPKRLPYRPIAFAMMVILVTMLVVPDQRNFFFTAPTVFLCFTNPWYAMIVQVAALVMGAMSLSLYFNWNRRALIGAADWLGYPLFMKLYTSYNNRLTILFMTNAYLAAAAVVATGAIAGTDILSLVSPVMAASFFECLLVIILAVPVRPAVAILAVAMLEGAFIAWFFPVAACVFVVVKFLPLILISLWMERKNVFSA